MLKGNCVKCKRNKSVTVSDATTAAEGLKDFFKSVGKATVSFGKKVANNTVRALEIAIKIGSAAASRNPRADSSITPGLINLATTGEGIKTLQKGRGLYLGTNTLCKELYSLLLMVNINTNFVLTKQTIITKH